MKNEVVTDYQNLITAADFWKAIGVLVMIFSGLIIAFQIFVFFDTGEWHKMSIIFLLQLIPETYHWATHPQSWLGIHKILNFIPLSITVFLIGGFTYLIGDGIEN